ncbi:MAG: lactate utilization protein [Bacillota bacterium]|nr:lactate utilization protein [Bacillota bacterium]
MEEKLSLFVKQAEAVGASVHQAGSKEKAKELVEKLINETDAEGTGVLWVKGAILDKFDSLKCTQPVHQTNFIDHAENAAFGVTEADSVLAETGSVVSDASDAGARIASMLPNTHIVLVNSKNVFAQTPDVIEKIKVKPPAYFSFITGPSRTADIERVLTIGVHGPERLEIILVD